MRPCVFTRLVPWCWPHAAAAAAAAALTHDRLRIRELSPRYIPTRFFRELNRSLRKHGFGTGRHYVVQALPRAEQLSAAPLLLWLLRRDARARTTLPLWPPREVLVMPAEGQEGATFRDLQLVCAQVRPCVTQRCCSPSAPAALHRRTICPQTTCRWRCCGPGRLGRGCRRPASRWARRARCGPHARRSGRAHHLAPRSGAAS